MLLVRAINGGNAASGSNMPAMITAFSLFLPRVKKKKKKQPKLNAIKSVTVNKNGQWFGARLHVFLFHPTRYGKVEGDHRRAWLWFRELCAQRQ